MAAAIGTQSGNNQITANATAISYDSTTGFGNAANAAASTTTIGGITGNASALSVGSSGTARTQSTAQDPTVTGQQVIANAAAPSNLSGVSTLTMANVAGTWFSTPSSYVQAYAGAMGSPTPVVQSQLVNSATPVVQAALSGYAICGAGILGANDAGSGPGSVTYTASSSHDYVLAGTHPFELGLLTMDAYAGGFSSLTFTVSEGRKTLVTDTFTSLSAADAYFTDDAVSLGKIKGAVDLTFSFSLTANAAEGAGISYVIADEPAAGRPASPIGQAADREHRGGLNQPIEIARNPLLYLEGSGGIGLDAALEDLNAGFASTTTLPRIEPRTRLVEMLEERLKLKHARR